MLEGTRGVTVCGEESAEIGGAWTDRRAAPEPRRGNLLARLSAMSLAGVGRRLDGDHDSETEVTAVARAWLELVDDGQYAVVWTVAAPALQQAIDEEEWNVALRSIRAPLGPCRSRTLRSQTTLDAFPGVPPGPYTVIHFESGFEARPEVIETVTTCLGTDGRWRVAAYFIR